ncbi:uncharacterized protein LOC134437380 [Engraulis encrasicolus]|uniref:uncharacterized protein LOC134437380 n=1 Tax=Engraulis encrasicolus TaxID=184585 RepID=UPI002FD5A324
MFYWYRDTQTSTPVSQTGGNSYSISSAKVSDGGQYWCRAGRGDPVYYTQYSNEALLNVTASVILEHPVHPVMEGDPLTLRCRYRNQPSNISAAFYKDGALLHTSSTGEMTIPAVSKSHEGLYKCNNTEKGQSLESWITVMHKMTGSMVAVGVVVGLVIASALVILLVLLHHKRKSKGSTTPNLGHQSSGYSRQPATASGDAVAGASDVVYADIKLEENGDKKNKKEKGKTNAAQSDTLYSTVKPLKTTDNSEDDDDPNDGSNVTYSEVTIKNKKGKKRGSAGPSDVTYADVHIKMKPLKSTDAGCDAGCDATYAQVRKKGKKPDTQDVRVMDNASSR